MTQTREVEYCTQINRTIVNDHGPAVMLMAVGEGIDGSLGADAERSDPQETSNSLERGDWPCCRSVRCKRADGRRTGAAVRAIAVAACGLVRSR